MSQTVDLALVNLSARWSRWSKIRKLASFSAGRNTPASQLFFTGEGCRWKCTLLYQHELHSCKSASERRLIIPSSQGFRSQSSLLPVLVPAWWNDVPWSVRLAQTITIFKKHLKTHTPLVKLVCVSLYTHAQTLTSTST